MRVGFSDLRAGITCVAMGLLLATACDQAPESDNPTGTTDIASSGCELNPEDVTLPLDPELSTLRRGAYRGTGIASDMWFDGTISMFAICALDDGAMTSAPDILQRIEVLKKPNDDGLRLGHVAVQLDADGANKVVVLGAPPDGQNELALVQRSNGERIGEFRLHSAGTSAPCKISDHSDVVWHRCGAFVRVAVDLPGSRYGSDPHFRILPEVDILAHNEDAVLEGAPSVFEVSRRQSNEVMLISFPRPQSDAIVEIGFRSVDGESSEEVPSRIRLELDESRSPES